MISTAEENQRLNYPTIPALRFIDLDAITKQCVETLYDENPNVWGHRIIEILAQDTLSQIRPLVLEIICFVLGAYLNSPPVESDEVYNTDGGSVYQNFSPVESTHNLPFEITADPLRTAVTLPRDTDNQAYTLFNAPLQPLGSETFLQIPPELQADFDTYSAYLDDFELQPDMLISSQTDSPPSPQVEGELSAQTLREIQVDIALLTDPLLTRYHPDQSSYYQEDPHCCYCQLYGHTH
ncbi:uncharacterized protein LOC117553121 isoform X2 [Gymnodraco acuticeps]|uniref:Uncharacterized protein LOC117553121 isoform X2 n=1 Tax=Gymnodraco acuticeps TaxID=8218 RepID=A0A6P8W594_GYMAC|nr:uncharacterized protein LOC117553121 isoform X2 [Gymnodraco acuticeps]